MQAEVAPVAVQLATGETSVAQWQSKWTLEAVRDMAVSTQL